MSSRKDVAAAAGVSVRTVSNVVNGFEHVAPETRKRVLEAIQRLSYRPSELARSLKVGRSGLVGLMLPELDTPYFAEVTREFVQQGTRNGLTVVIDQTDGDRDRELSWIHRTARGSLFDALVLSPLGLQGTDLSVLPLGSPVVFLGEDHFPGFDQVTVDNFASSRAAVAHLASSGRRRIAAIGAERDFRATSSQRLAGYHAALAAAGLPADDRLVGYVKGFKRAEGYRAMLELLEQPEPPDGVFCFSDPVALGALRALHERGVRVPEEVAIVGWDDIEDGRYSTPSLTTISPDKRQLATTVFDRLLRRLDGEALEPEVVLTPYDLVVRESAPASR